jgi:hypothetical protein
MSVSQFLSIVHMQSSNRKFKYMKPTILCLSILLHYYYIHINVTVTVQSQNKRLHCDGKINVY